MTEIADFLMNWRVKLRWKGICSSPWKWSATICHMSGTRKENYNMRVLLLNDTENVYHWGCYGTSHAIKDQLLKKGATSIDCLPVALTHSLKNVPDTVADLDDREMFFANHAELADRIK